MRSVDKYVYPGTRVLVNKYGCRDAGELKELESRSVMGNLVYLQLHPLGGDFDFQHLKDIHRFIFQDVYDWAGKIRTIDIGKNNLFCRAMFINDYAKEVFGDFYSSCYDSRGDRQCFTDCVVKHYADLNALHPFREGNGRTQREFTRELCLKCGYIFDLTGTSYKEMVQASVLSFDKGDNSKLSRIFQKCIVPKSEYQDLQERLASVTMIFSRDDIDR
ncbi:MAG: Fic family protein [Eubacterium sp.]|nr:Fic family protein [Eubacterium sp.]